MRIHKLVLPVLLGSVLLSGTAYSQQIQTNTSATTQGSTQFGYLPNGADLGVFMQTTVAPTCTTVSTNVQTCTSDGGTAVGDNDNFVRVDQMPGSFTDRPITAISSNPNFACGRVASSTNCSDLNVPGNLAGGLIFLTSPGGVGVTGPNQLIGNINTNINLGDAGATAGMPDGFIAFTLDPAVAGGSSATIDQFIDHSIDLGGGSLMVFQQREATIGAGNLIPDLAMSDPDNNPLTLLPFLTTFLNHTLALPAFDIGLVSRTMINQGAADGFGALNLDATFNFPASQENGGLGPGWFPTQGAFVTPGLNTGINAVGFGPEFNRFGFP